MTQTNELTKAAINLFTMKGYKVWRQNNAAVWDEKHKAYRKGSVMKGVSDIIGYSPTGQFVACEIKTGKDKLSPYQTNFLKEVAHAGGAAYVIHNIDELVQLQNKL